MSTVMPSLTLPPYPAYKPSSVPWLGDVPVHWEVRRLRTVAEMRVSNVDKHTRDEELPVRLCNYVDVYKHDRIVPAMPFMTATASLDEVERFRLERDDVLITKDSEAWTDIGVPCLVAESADDLLSGYHLALLRPSAGILGPYLALALQSKAVAYQFHVRANGVTRYGLTHAGIKSVQIPLPPLSEQHAIVRYLAYVDRRIRRYVGAKRRLIPLLAEERQAIVNRAVTRGLNPDVRLKPSGVEWLGDVPEHWEVRRLKQAGRLVAGTGFPVPLQGVQDEEFPFFKVGNLAKSVDDRWLSYSDSTISRETASSLRAHVLPKGAIAYAKIGEALRLNRRRIIARPACIDNNMTAFVPNSAVITIEWALHSLSMLDFGKHVSPGAVPSLSEGDQAVLSIPLPPPLEQRAIVQYIDQETARIDAAIAHARRQIELVQEYRTRLIADVVTGKVDVREASALLPEEADETEEPIDEDSLVPDNGDSVFHDASEPEEDPENEVSA